MARSHKMISPFVAHLVTDEVISYGLSSFGYDVRLARDYRVHAPEADQSHIIDPKQIAQGVLREYHGDTCIIQPGDFVLASTVETLRIPRDCIGLMVSKSTYARMGVVIPATVLEPGWVGQANLMISNGTQLPARIYAGEGIAQILFFQGGAPDISYDDRKGKYQRQRGLQSPIITHRETPP